MNAEKDARREVIHDRDCGVPTGRTWACACNERNGYARPLPLHRTEAGYPNCSTCDGGGCYDCTDPA